MLKILKMTIGAVDADGLRDIATPPDDVIIPALPDEYYIKHKQDGLDRLHIEMHETPELRKYARERAVIAFTAPERSETYVIQTVDVHAGIMTIDAMVDVRDWERDQFYITPPPMAEQPTLEEAIGVIIPGRWSVFGDVDALARTARVDPKKMTNKTGFEILVYLLDVWNVKPVFNSPAGTLRIVDPTIDTLPQSVGLMEDYQAYDVNYSIDTSKMASEIYPQGAKGDDGKPVTIASVNGGNPFLRAPVAYPASNPGIKVFTDTAAKTPAELLQSAQRAIDRMGRPERSIKLKVRDVDAIIKELHVHDWVTICINGEMIRRRVVEWTEYPGNRVYDTYSIESTMPSLERTINRTDPGKTDGSISDLSGINREPYVPPAPSGSGGEPKFPLKIGGPANKSIWNYPRTGGSRQKGIWCADYFKLGDVNYTTDPDKIVYGLGEDIRLGASPTGIDIQPIYPVDSRKSNAKQNATVLTVRNGIHAVMQMFTAWAKGKGNGFFTDAEGPYHMEQVSLLNGLIMAIRECHNNSEKVGTQRIFMGDDIGEAYGISKYGPSEIELRGKVTVYNHIADDPATSTLIIAGDHAKTSGHMDTKFYRLGVDEKGQLYAKYIDPRAK